MLQTSQITVLGSINVDHIIHCAQFPRPGETLQGQRYQQVAGGKGANQAVAVARLGGQPQFIACMGDDGFAQQMQTYFAEQGIDTTGVRKIVGEATGVALIYVNHAAENTIVISPEANAQLSADYVNSQAGLITRADYLLLQLETPLSGVMQALQWAQQYSTQVILNPAPAQALSDSLLQQVNVITPNETETEVLTGIFPSDEECCQVAADRLHDKGIDTVIITLGKNGAYLSDKQTGLQQRVASPEVNALDTTAAGDTFNGALVVARARGEDWLTALQFAGRAAAISVTRYGAQPAIPCLAELAELGDIK